MEFIKDVSWVSVDFAKRNSFFQNQGKKENSFYKTSTTCENITRKGICNTGGEAFRKFSNSIFAKNRLATTSFTRD